MKMSSFLRILALNGKVNVYDVRAINELSVQISKIGTNINQIAAMVNQTKTVYKNDTEKILEEFSKIERVIERYLDKFEDDNNNLME